MIAAFAIWFGGFTFYTSVVVPIGTDVLGSSRTQGFVTQQVTNVLNMVGGVTLLLGFLDFFFEIKARTRKLNFVLITTLALLALLWIGLLVLHPKLDAMLEPEHEHVSDESHFYQLHRAYLWISTVQWLLCWVWLVLLAKCFSGQRVDKDDSLATG